MTARPHQVAPMTEEDVPALLRELIGKVDALAAEVALLRADMARRIPLRRDAEATAALLAAISESVAGRTFSAAELVDHATLTTAGGLRDAIVDAVGSLDARRLGKLLKRMQGAPGEGLRVVRVGEDGDGARWELWALPVTGSRR